MSVERTSQGDVKVSHKGLVSQLADAAAHSGGQGEGGGGKAVYGSRPPLSEEPWHVLMDIEAAARALASEAGANRPMPLSRVIRNLALWAAGSGADRVRQVEAAMRDWRYAAEVALGHKRRMRLLQAPCPLCGESNSLRVWADDFGPDRASCRACREEWDRSNMGLLASELLDGRLLALGVG